LPPDFYTRISEYLRKLIEENQRTDSKPPKSSLLKDESKNVQQMLSELLINRYEKLLQVITKNQKIPKEMLSTEEAKICESLAAFAIDYHKFTRELLEGQPIQTAPFSALDTRVPAICKRATLRFIKNIPAIMGSDLKSYGPFIVEDVASLPVENARMLVKQGLAVMVEVY